MRKLQDGVSQLKKRVTDLEEVETLLNTKLQDKRDESAKQDKDQQERIE